MEEPEKVEEEVEEVEDASDNEGKQVFHSSHAVT